MASPQTDWDLLTRYVRMGDHDAFARLVHRQIAFVYSLARRQTRDAHLAEDVTQAVMIVLARKAGTVRGEASLSGWLFSVTRHAARNALKMRARQSYHERRAAEERPESLPVRADPVETRELHHVLDEAIARLPQLERSGVLLHYYHGQTHEAVASVLGMSAHAAQKRVSRALEKMRTFLAGRGVAVSDTGVVEAMRGGMPSASAPPAGLASSAVTVALLASGSHAPAGTGALVIAKGVTRMFTLAKLKVAATIALVVTGFAGAAALPLATLARRTLTTVTTTSLMSDAAPATKPADESGKFVADAGNGVRVEFLGVSPFPGDESSWFNIAGEHIEVPDPHLLESNVHTEPAPQHQLAIRIHRSKGVVVLPYIEGAMMAANTHSDADADESYLLISRFTLQNPADTVSVRLGISGSDWKTIATSDDAQQQAEVDAGKYGGVTFSPPEKDDSIGGAKIDVHHDPFELPNQLVAIDDEGKEHVAHNVNVRNTNGDCTSTHTFELPAEKIKKVRLQLREFDKFVEAKDITLSVENKTQPKITVTDAKKK